VAEVQATDIPEEIVALPDERAGKIHSQEGRVLITLAEILTLWERINGRG